MKSPEETLKFLYESGLLFEINRKILHPYGMALTFSSDNETGEIKLHGLEETSDKEGFYYLKEDFEIGKEKINNSIKKYELNKKLKNRLEYFDWIVQEEPLENEPE